jgi:hypothetical protein
MASPSHVCGLLAKAGFDSPEVEAHEKPARFPSIEAFLRTEIDGWVLKGCVDVDALIPEARQRLQPYIDPNGAVAIPMAGHVVTCSKP